MSKYSPEEERGYIDSMLAYHIIKENENSVVQGKISNDTKQNVIYDLFMLAKVVENGNFIESD